MKQELLNDCRKHLNRFFALQVKQTDLGNAGVVRKLSGENVESLLTMIWESIAKDFDCESEIIKGNNKPIEVFSKSGNYSIKASVDKHCYIDGKFVLAVECKTYLDKCYMQRASSDFEIIKRNKETKTMILSIENGLSDNSFYFFIDEGFTDEVFYLAIGKRNSAKHKRIYYNTDRGNDRLILNLIDYIEGVFIGNCK